MKKQILIFIVITSMLMVGCSTKNNSTQNEKREDTKSSVIAILGNSWDREYSAAIFCDSIEFEKAVSQSKIYQNKSEVDEFISIRNLVSKSALTHLEKYIENNCNKSFPSQNDLKDHYTLFTTKIIKDTQTPQECFYYAKNLDMVINYFTGMKNWIQNSMYKEEFGPLLSYIDGNINELKKLK